MDTSFASFVLISAVVIVTPGPDTALTIRNILIGGRSGGVSTALGVAAGQALWALAASAGVVSILIASEPLFHAIRLAGALYLIYLGARSLLTAMRGREGPGTIGVGPAARLAVSAAFRQGFISNLANPKMAVFFASILPQFAPLDGGTFGGLILLGAVFCSMTFVWLGAYALVIGKVRSAFQSSRLRRLFEGLTGGVLVTLGVRVATAER